MRKIRADELVRNCMDKLKVKDISEILWLNISEVKYDSMIEINEKQEWSLFWYINKTPWTKK